MNAKRVLVFSTVLAIAAVASAQQQPLIKRVNDCYVLVGGVMKLQPVDTTKKCMPAKDGKTCPADMTAVGGYCFPSSMVKVNVTRDATKNPLTQSQIAASTACKACQETRISCRGNANKDLGLCAKSAQSDARIHCERGQWLADKSMMDSPGGVGKIDCKKADKGGVFGNLCMQTCVARWVKGPEVKGDTSIEIGIGPLSFGKTLATEQDVLIYGLQSQCLAKYNDTLSKCGQLECRGCPP